jgi:IclR family KDG regulon transcriptional repressor
MGQGSSRRDACFHWTGTEQVTVLLERPRRSKSAPVGVVGKLIQILERLDQAPGGLLLREIVNSTSINKSTAYRFLSHLETEGYVFRDSDGYYMVGPKLAKLGNGATYQATLCRSSAQILEKLRTDTGETVNLAVLDGSEILYLSVFESQHTFRMVSEVGRRRPLYCTALGKAILAHLPPEQQRKIIGSTQFESFTPHTVGSAEELNKDLHKIHRRGYALDDEETVAGARCIAVAILNQDRKVIGGVSVSGPVVRVTKRQIAEFAALLRTAADEIASRLKVLSE